MATDMDHSRKTSKEAQAGSTNSYANNFWLVRRWVLLNYGRTTRLNRPPPGNGRLRVLCLQCAACQGHCTTYSIVESRVLRQAQLCQFRKGGGSCGRGAARRGDSKKRSIFGRVWFKNVDKQRIWCRRSAHVGIIVETSMLRRASDF